MDIKGDTHERKWSPVIIMVLVVIVGSIVNLLIVSQPRGPRSIPDGFERVHGDMGFVKWGRASGMTDMEPNTLFAIVNGKIVGQFEFRSGSYRMLQSAGLSDNAQRSWIHVYHSDGTYSVDRYPEGDDDIMTKPIVTFLDKDGNGLIDRKVDWVARKTYDATGPLSWLPHKPATKPSKP